MCLLCGSILHNWCVARFLRCRFHITKLKSTAGEYKTLFDFISKQGHQFIWVTDGLGWTKTLRPLEETFLHIDYTLNLNMIASGLLAEIITQNLWIVPF